MDVNLNQTQQDESPTRLHEKLQPELQESLEDRGEGTLTLSHPLVIIPFYSEHFAQQANAVLSHKTKRIQKAIKTNNWDSIIWLHERPYRLWAFSQFSKFMKPEQYWKILKAVWMDSEFPMIEKDLWLSMFTAQIKQKRKFMSGSERRVLQSLPETVDIYRGYNGSKQGTLGLSWTLSKDKALGFAHRFGEDDPFIAIATCKRDSILAYFHARGEQEIIIDPLDAQIVDNEQVVDQAESTTTV